MKLSQDLPVHQTARELMNSGRFDLQDPTIRWHIALAALERHGSGTLEIGTRPGDNRAFLDELAKLSESGSSALDIIDSALATIDTVRREKQRAVTEELARLCA